MFHWVLVALGSTGNAREQGEVIYAEIPAAGNEGRENPRRAEQKTYR